eukprot:TRINITY_DN103_c0_g1_i2.p2 TRINITY_DN103_c0_g1~~TRINITY_DN103_c0_g1_i2.p2  ORF type:complete len:144 (+),score=32.36 TRINITY_DN103_c0_g1_i2:79-510(+)
MASLLQVPQVTSGGSGTASPNPELKKKPTAVLNKPISKGKGEVSLSAFAFLFSEYIQYSQSKVSNLNDLEKRLSDIGYAVGVRLLELITFREKNNKRETKLVGILQFISYTVWKVLFGKQADSLEKSNEQDDECKTIPLEKKS